MIRVSQISLNIDSFEIDSWAKNINFKFSSRPGRVMGIWCMFEILLIIFLRIWSNLSYIN